MAVPPLGWVNTSRPRIQNPDSRRFGVVLLKTQCVFNHFAGSPSPRFGSETPCLAMTPHDVPEPPPGHPKGTLEVPKGPIPPSKRHEKGSPNA